MNGSAPETGCTFAQTVANVDQVFAGSLKVLGVSVATSIMMRSCREPTNSASSGIPGDSERVGEQGIDPGRDGLIGVAVLIPMGDQQSEMLHVLLGDVARARVARREAHPDTARVGEQGIDPGRD